MQYLTETELNNVVGGNQCFPDNQGNLPPLGVGPWVIYPPMGENTPEVLAALLQPQRV